MRFNLKFAHFLTLLVLPLVVVWLDLGALTTFCLLLLWLMSGWFITIKNLATVPDKKIILETIPPSHFVEKVRWCLDLCKIDYEERADGGTLGVFYAGRTVPRLRVYTGGVWSSIGNSQEILRFIWGQYGHTLGPQAAFLEPTVERVEMEKRLDKYGQYIQQWVYSHILGERQFMLHSWGCNDPGVPAIQRWLLRILYPVQVVLMRKVFRLNDSALQHSYDHIEPLLEELDAHLQNSDKLVGTERSYIDYTFASMSALWVQPDLFGNGAADGVRLPEDQYPASVLADKERWSKRFPHVVSFVNQLYLTERKSLPS